MLIASCAPTLHITKMTYPKPFEFELIDTVAGTKGELYVKANEWIAKTYGSAKAVIDMQDKEAGKLIGKCIIEAPILSTYRSIITAGQISYIMTIDVKDGRYRCVVSDFSHKGGTYIDIIPLTNSTRVYNGRNYGDLQDDTKYYNSEATGKKVEDKKYYLIKNLAMTNAQDVLASLRKAMHQKEKEF
jgi:hypothetical protein